MANGNLKEQINQEVKAALKAADKAKATTLRMILAAIKQQEVDQRIELADDQITVIMDKMIKERRDAIDKYQQANRPELAEKEQVEITIIQQFLPTPLTADEITQLITQAIQDCQAQSMQDMGKVMAQLKPQMQGRADMGKVSAEIKKLLA